jgi:hypothetical protein
MAFPEGEFRLRALAMVGNSAAIGFVPARVPLSITKLREETNIVKARPTFINGTPS